LLLELKRGISQKKSKSYTGKAVLGLKLFSRSSIVINQSEARALATTELMVETVDLQRIFKDSRESSTDPAGFSAKQRH
jgi:hypothetical protein